MTGSYKTIGKAIKKSENSVRKYVAALEEKGLITTEPTNIRTNDGLKRNGSLLYTIRPIQEAIDRFHARQMERLELDAARKRARERLAKESRVSPCKPTCAALENDTAPCPGGT